MVISLFFWTRLTKNWCNHVEYGSIGFYNRNSGSTHVKVHKFDLVFSNQISCDFAEVNKPVTSGPFCASFEINSFSTIEHLRMKEKRGNVCGIDGNIFHYLTQIILRLMK